MPSHAPSQWSLQCACREQLEGTETVPCPAFTSLQHCTVVGCKTWTSRMYAAPGLAKAFKLTYHLHSLPPAGMTDA